MSGLMSGDGKQGGELIVSTCAHPRLYQAESDLRRI